MPMMTEQLTKLQEGEGRVGGVGDVVGDGVGGDCKRLTQGTFSKIPQTVRPRVALQLDLETAYLAGCQRVVHQLVRG